MKEKKRIFNTLTLGQIAIDVIMVILGIYIASEPSVSNETIGYVLGIVFIVRGLYGVIKYIMEMNKKTAAIMEFVFGVVSVIAGIFMMLNPFSLANMLTIGIGVWILLSGLFKLALALQFMLMKEETWILNIVISVLTIVLGVIILVNPFETLLVLTTMLGILLCCYSLMDILQQILFRKRVKEIIGVFFE